MASPNQLTQYQIEYIQYVTQLAKQKAIDISNGTDVAANLGLIERILSDINDLVSDPDAEPSHASPGDGVQGVCCTVCESNYTLCRQSHLQSYCETALETCLLTCISTC